MAEPQVVLHTRVVTGTGGGPDKTILNSPRFANGPEFRLVCVYLRHPNDEGFEVLAKRAEQWGAELVAVDDYGPFDWGMYSRLLEICQKYQPAIWHGHDYKTNYYGLRLKSKLPMICMTTAHGWVKHTWKTPLYYALDRYCLPRCEGVVCVSEDLYQRCQRLGVAEDRCWLVANGIDTQEFQRMQPAAQAKRAWGWPPEMLVISAVGRLSAEKGLAVLLQAFRALLAEHPEARLVIAGEGDQELPLKALAKELDIAEKVEFPGFVVDPRKLYEASDLFVSSSLREGLPNVLLEAMAYQLPVVCTNIAGVPSLVQSGENGQLVEPGDHHMLAAELAILAGDPQRRERLGQAARQVIEQRFSFAKRMETMKDIYRTLLARQPQPAGTL